MNYIMIHKDLIINDAIGDKRIIVYTYFYSRQTMDEKVSFSCNDIVKWCGYTINYHKGRSNDQISAVILKLKEYDYLRFDKLNSADIFNLAEINQDKFNPNSQFALVYFDELEKIRDFKRYTEDKNRMSSAILILVLSYLRVNMLRRQEQYFGKKSEKPEFFYHMYVDIEKDIGISKRYISRAVNILNELDIIASRKLPRYKDSYNNWHTDVTLFVNRHKRNKNEFDEGYDYKQELEWGEEFVKKNKHLNKKFDQDI